MTWILVYRPRFGAVQNEIKAEWSDEQMQQAAEMIKDRRKRNLDIELTINILKEFLPQPIKEAL